MFSLRHLLFDPQLGLVSILMPPTKRATYPHIPSTRVCAYLLNLLLLAGWEKAKHMLLFPFGRFTIFRRFLAAPPSSKRASKRKEHVCQSERYWWSEFFPNVGSFRPNGRMLWEAIHWLSFRTAFVGREQLRVNLGARENLDNSPSLEAGCSFLESSVSFRKFIEKCMRKALIGMHVQKS